RDRIKLVIMAASALDRQPEQRGADAGGHFGEQFLPVYFRIGVAADEMNRAAAAKAGRNQEGSALARVSATSQLVARELLSQKLTVRLILIQGMDHVVAVTPRVRALAVGFVAVGFRVAHDIQPVLSPAFAVVGRSQQALD